MGWKRGRLVTRIQCWPERMNLGASGIGGKTGL
jgi:hypothetical protein